MTKTNKGREMPLWKCAMFDSQKNYQKTWFIKKQEVDGFLRNLGFKKASVS